MQNLLRTGNKVLIPGDIEREKEIKIRAEGVSILPAIAKEISEIAVELGIEFENSDMVTWRLRREDPAESALASKKSRSAVLQLCSLKTSEFGFGCSLVRYYFAQNNTEQGTLNIKHRRFSTLKP